MKKNIQELLLAIIKDALKKLKLDITGSFPVILDIPGDLRFGDFSTNIALVLSKPLKQPPIDIAKEISASIKQIIDTSCFKNYVREIRVEGAGFINFYLQDKYFLEFVKDIAARGEKVLRLNLGKGEPTLIEFVSANPTGPLSVAHARQAAVGDILANILNFLGFKIKKEFYLNDEGNQINILGQSIALRIKELEGEKIEFPEDHYQGEYIQEIAKEVRSQKSPPRDLAGPPRFVAEKVRSLSEYGVKYILDIIRKELDDFGVKFDNWYSQKALSKSGKIEKTLKFLKKKGFIYDNEGAVWFASQKFGDDKDRVVIKSDKSYTYLAPDIAYHQDKYKRGFRWLINLWGPDHHGYINRLKASIAALGQDPKTLDVVIVQLATLFRDGKPVQMSTRRAQYITLREILSEVGKDAARFFFLMRRTSSHLDFDLDIAKKQTSENPVYYVQYAHARISSILRNSRESLKKINFRKSDLSLLKEKEEVYLAKKILQFSHILNICYQTVDPYMLTVYLQELSEAFHKFYDRHRVLGQQSALTNARLTLIESTRIVLALGLKLMGVSLPESM